MGLLVFVVVAAVVVAGPLIWMARKTNRRSGPASMVILWHANSEVDREMTVGALRSAGVEPYLVDVGPPHPYEPGNVGPVAGYRWEIWVPTRDERRAREVLGLPGPAAS